MNNTAEGRTPLTAKEFLGRAYRLDKRIDCKIQQVASLNELATKATGTLTGMPRSPSPSPSRMEDVIAKIVDMQEKINADIDRLVDTKAEITEVIRSVENDDYRNLLELRYLCFKEWEQLAEEMHFSLRWTYTMHGRALAAVDRILERRAEERS